MTVYFAILIPIIITIFVYLFYKSSFVWWEVFVPVITVLIAIVIAKTSIDTLNVTFTEYWGSTIVAVYEEEPYNYWHSETCSRQVACGTDSKGNTQYCTEYYDCSHQDDVGPSWWAITNIGEKIDISEKLHDELVAQFGTAKKSIKSRKNYSSSDKCVGSKGTKFQNKRVGNVSHIYETKWNGTDHTRKAYSSRHKYTNKIKASDYTVFQYTKINEETAAELGLFEYPKFINGFTFPTILGVNVNKDTHEKFKRLNGKFGKSNQLRLWLLVFDNKPIQSGIMQEHYWVGGNKNELVVCIGKSGNSITWSHAFSWGLSTTLTADIKNKVLDLYTYRDSIIENSKIIPTAGLPIDSNIVKNMPVLPNPIKSNIIKIKSPTPILNNQTLDELYEYLNSNLYKFKRRSFSEFDYLTIELSTKQMWFIYILAFVVSIFTNIWVVRNDIEN